MSKTKWPNLSESELLAAIQQYQSKKRRTTMRLTTMCPIMVKGEVTILHLTMVVGALVEGIIVTDRHIILTAEDIMMKHPTTIIVDICAQ